MPEKVFDKEIQRYLRHSHGEIDILEKQITFITGTTGANGQHDLFNVTGSVVTSIVGVCTSDLTSGGTPTISVGTVNNVAGILG